jgi:hypothetical protein
MFLLQHIVTLSSSIRILGSADFNRFNNVYNAFFAGIEFLVGS